jgi:hypothetical protein
MCKGSSIKSFSALQPKSLSSKLRAFRSRQIHHIKHKGANLHTSKMS